MRAEQKFTALVADRDTTSMMHKSMADSLSRKGWAIQEVGNFDQLLDRLKGESKPDLVLVDATLNGSVIDIPTIIHAHSSDTLVAVFLPHPDESIYYAVLGRGAFMCYSKPLKHNTLANLFGGACKNILERRKGRLMHAFWGVSRHARDLQKRIDEASRSRLPVLILGPRGIGKCLVARCIYNSSRAMGAFIRMNVAAIHPDRVEAELNGWQRGAFTGAIGRFIGLVLAAANGVLFIDEIGALAIWVQVNLNDILEEHVVRPLASTGERNIDFRPIAATNRDLIAMVSRGEFSADLWDRLSAGYVTEMLGLKYRREDIGPLFHHLINDLSMEKNSAVPEIKAGVVDLISNYDWPGNTRHLKAFAERCLDKNQDTVTSDMANHILEDVKKYRIPDDPVPTSPLDIVYQMNMNPDQLLRLALQHALFLAGGSVKLAAPLAGYTRTRFSQLSTKLGLATNGAFRRGSGPTSLF